MVLPLQLLDVTDSRVFATTTACTTADIQTPLPSPARVAFSDNFVLQTDNRIQTKTSSKWIQIISWIIKLQNQYQESSVHLDSAREKDEIRVKISGFTGKDIIDSAKEQQKKRSCLIQRCIVFLYRTATSVKACQYIFGTRMAYQEFYTNVFVCRTSG